MAVTSSFDQLIHRCSSALTTLAHDPDEGRTEIATTARILLMLHEGEHQRNVARKFGLSTNRVIEMRRRFILLGLPGLEPRKAAKKTKKVIRRF